MSKIIDTEELFFISICTYVGKNKFEKMCSEAFIPLKNTLIYKSDFHILEELFQKTVQEYQANKGKAAIKEFKITNHGNGDTYFSHASDAISITITKVNFQIK